MKWICAAAAILVLIVTCTSMRGGIEYFNPQTLAIKSQSERTIYATEIPVYRSPYAPVHHALIDFLIEQGWVTPQVNTSDCWELVYHWNEAWKDGYGPWYDVLYRDHDELLQWSLDHPDCAKVYWTEGFRLLRSPDPHEITLGRALFGYYRVIMDVTEMNDLMAVIDQIKAGHEGQVDSNRRP
ncbi:MAG: hypothetical protein M5U26_17985 [Planctomycetota bacterium]|nr:hypothetical protein [Planctomycetota bacterium]